MTKNLTEDAVRDKARDILGFQDKNDVQSGVGQLTTFNQLGFNGVADKPDGWYLPNNHTDTAVVLETKASKIVLGNKQVDEILKNVRIIEDQYEQLPSFRVRYQEPVSPNDFHCLRSCSKAL